MRFGFLSTMTAPLLPSFLASALANGVADIVVFCDAKTDSEKDLRIWQERTGGAFDPSQGGRDIYALEQAGIPFYFVSSHNGQQTLNLIHDLAVDCLFNAGTPRKLSEDLIAATAHGIVNVHPGLLPAYRGASCVEWAIYNDDKVGNTAHFMDKGYDTGPIITSEWYEFRRDADYQSIRVDVYRKGCDLAGRVLADIQSRKLTPQDATAQSDGKYYEPISNDLFQEVLNKVANGSYAYQRLD